MFFILSPDYCLLITAFMKIIDIHTHVGDLVNGWPLDEAYTKPVWSPGFIAEWTGYRTSKPPFRHAHDHPLP